MHCILFVAPRSLNFQVSRHYRSITVIIINHKTLLFADREICVNKQTEVLFRSRHVIRREETGSAHVSVCTFGE